MATKNQSKKPAADPAVTKAPAAGSSASSGQSPAEDKPPVPTKAPALKIVCARDGFRRAGIAFSKQPTIIKRSHLTKTQIEQLKAEPLLTVTEVEIDDDYAERAATE